jgi:predicted transcriptional regulator
MREFKNNSIGMIVAAYVSQQDCTVDLEHLTYAIETVRKAMGDAKELEPLQVEITSEPKSSMSIEDSVRGNVLISFEDGKSYKSLKRHLTRMGLTPQQYREKHGLPTDYPMTAPEYSKARSELAKKMQLGRKKKA